MFLQLYTILQNKSLWLTKQRQFYLSVEILAAFYTIAMTKQIS